jgi:hypothetical protein
LPEDFDEQFALIAPVDQRPVTYFQGGERVELVNLTPQGMLPFSLPRVGLKFTTLFGQRREEHIGRLTSVILEPDDRRMMLVWQMHLLVRSRDVDYLDGTVIEESSCIL